LLKNGENLSKGVPKINFEILLKTCIFRVLPKKLLQAMDEVKNFFGLIFKFGALMVSEMGCYDLKCEKAIITAS
jgi:hypothetical protein